MMMSALFSSSILFLQKENESSFVIFIVFLFSPQFLFYICILTLEAFAFWFKFTKAQWAILATHFYLPGC